MFVKFDLRIVSVTVCVTVLVACGGGGGGGGGSGAVPTPTTLATTTTTSTTTTSTLATTNRLYLADDSLIFDDGFSTKTTYTLAQFQSEPGIAVTWPMYDTAAIKFTIVNAGGFSVPAGQTLSAALSISDTAPGSQGVVKFYVDNVAIVQNGTDLTLTVPSSAVAWVYGLAVDGTGAMLKDFRSSVVGATSTLSLANNAVSSMTLGSALNSALNGVGTTSSMVGTYKVTMVVTQLPLSLTNGAALNTYTIDVPKSLADLSVVRSITGVGLEGFINLSAR
jgi:hypothetical protein